MKKITKLFLLPLISLLASCGNASMKDVNEPYTLGYTSSGVPVLNAVEAGEGSFTTYLMMSKYGYINLGAGDIFGADVDEKYYENCIIYKSAAGAELPSADMVFTTVKGSSFRGWAMYVEEKGVHPQYLTKVPETNGSTLYAIFDGTNAGGGGGDTPTGEFVDGNYYVVGNKDYSTAISKAGESWNDPSKAYKMNEISSEDPNVKKQFKASITFAKGDEWKIRSKDWLGVDRIENGGAMSDGSMSVVGDNIQVLTADTYDIYLKVYQTDYVSYYIASNSGGGGGGDTPSGTNFTVYFETADWWNADGAATNIHYWGDVKTTWPGVKMTYVNTTTWRFDVPAGVSGFMFVRVSNDGKTDWGAKTVNLAPSQMGNNNMYSISSTSATWGDPGVSGVWSVYQGQ